jgi:hypothetical protein
MESDFWCSPVHGLLACGGEDGALECFDLRQKKAVGRIDTVGSAGHTDQVNVLYLILFCILEKQISMVLQNDHIPS